MIRVRDLAVPKDVDELRRIAATCARHRIPVTLRGGGTGNYGQCTPMQRGVIVETLALNGVQIHPGSATVQTVSVQSPPKCGRKVEICTAGLPDHFRCLHAPIQFSV